MSYAKILCCFCVWKLYRMACVSVSVCQYTATCLKNAQGLVSYMLEI
jgi:hypothetical protein